MPDHDPAISAVAEALAGTRLGATDLAEFLQRVALGAVDTVAGVVEASVLYTAVDGETVLARTGTLAEELAENRIGEMHPRQIEVAHADETFVVPDMRSETRWPPFAARATALGVLSWVGVPVPGIEGGRVVLDLYGSRPLGTGSPARGAAEALVAGVAVPLGNMVTLHECRKAVERLRARTERDAVLARAHGVLMGRFGFTQEVARRAVEQRARTTRVPAEDLAALLVAEVDRGDSADVDRYRPA